MHKTTGTTADESREHASAAPDKGSKPGSPFTIDVGEAQRFLDLIDPEQESFLFAAGDDDEARVKTAMREAKEAGRAPPVKWEHRRGNLSKSTLRWMTGRQAGGWGIFISTQAMRGGICRKSELAYIRVIFAEMDIAEPLKPWPIPPSIIVETSPGHFHVYWLILSGTPVTAEDFQGIMMCLVESYGSDPDAKDLARRLRFPGTWNLKPNREPHQVKIVEATGARYSRDELLEAFPPPTRRKPDPSEPRPKFNGHAAPGLERFHQPLKSIPAIQYGVCIRVGQALHHESGGSAEGLAMFDAWCATCTEKWAQGWAEEKWRSFKGRGITGGTIFGIAEEQGWRRAEHPHKQPRNANAKANGADRDHRQSSNGTNGAKHDHHRAEDINEKPKPEILVPLIQIAPGRLSQIATEAEAHLLTAGVLFYQRSSELVRPVLQEVMASDGRRTKAAALAQVSEAYMRDQLGRSMKWERFVRREKEWIPIDPPKDVSETILARSGEWTFPTVNGVITTPTLRHDGTILHQPGYDPSTGLILIDPPTMPDIPERPTRDDALTALGLLKALLAEFPFIDAASRSVALSGLITPVVRGVMDVAPMHTARASVASSGKSFLWDVASFILSGQKCPVIAAGRDEAETEKRLVSCALAAYQMFNLDNVNGELYGDFLCQMVERSVVVPRILGQSKAPQLNNRWSVFATGNNIRVVGDMTRRTLISSMDAKVERPELRQFKFNPVQTVLTDRGRYVAAVLTIARAYFAAGRPGRLTPPLASFERWSDTVRSALVWLDEADPVDTLNVARAEDPDLLALSAFLEAWRDAFGIGRERSRSTGEVLAKADQRVTQYSDIGHMQGSTDELQHAELHEVIDQIVGAKDRSRALGRWLSRHAGRPVNCHRIMRDDTSKKVSKWYVEQI
jgi:putative DNA primase/helicase